MRMRLFRGSQIGFYEDTIVLSTGYPLVVNFLFLIPIIDLVLHNLFFLCLQIKN